MRLAVGLVLAGMLGLPCPDAWADPADPSDAHVFNYGKAHPQCVRWSDDCRTCTTAGCSNIGIACQPGEVHCLDDKTAPPAIAPGGQAPAPPAR